MGRLNWLEATVVQTVAETARVRSLVVHVPEWPRHRAGQHVDIRLTAEDGYQAQRSYSIASAPGDDRLILTVELVDNGEVSTYLVDELRPGDRFELRGPIGGYFVWDVELGGPLLLVAGGSGVVPLAAMIRHRVRAESDVPVRLLYSSRSFDVIIYREELEHLAAWSLGVEVTHTLTRSRPPDWTGYGRRIDALMLREVAWPASVRPLAYVCGPTRFVESVADHLLGLGHDPQRIKTERFGPTGGRDGP